MPKSQQSARVAAVNSYVLPDSRSFPKHLVVALTAVSEASSLMQKQCLTACQDRCEVSQHPAHCHSATDSAAEDSTSYRDCILVPCTLKNEGEIVRSHRVGGEQSTDCKDNLGQAIQGTNVCCDLGEFIEPSFERCSGPVTMEG